MVFACPVALYSAIQSGKCVCERSNPKRSSEYGNRRGVKWSSAVHE